MFWKLCATLVLLGVTAPTSSADPVQYNCSTAYNYYTPAQDQYILSIANLTAINLWDGPSYLAAAPTTATTTSLTLAELKYYNYFAVSVYCPYTLTNLTCCYCDKFRDSVTFYKIITSSQYDTLALLTLHPSKNEIVVTFRGSVAFLNIIMDATFLSANISPDIRIHRGAYLCLMSLYNQIVTELNTLTTANPSYRIVVTGHSLGGAMASLFTFFMKSLNQFPGRNYVLSTYGQFRSGNKGYADYMNALSIPMARVVARADLAAHIIPVSALGLLPTLLGFYYVHHGQEVWINGNTTVFCSKTKYEDPSCSNSMGPGYTLEDHLQYFDTDITPCTLVEGWGNADFLNLPVGWTPTDYIPPMPTKMYDFLLPVVQGGYHGILPLL